MKVKGDFLVYTVMEYCWETGSSHPVQYVTYILTDQVSRHHEIYSNLYNIQWLPRRIQKHDEKHMTRQISWNKILEDTLDATYICA